MSAHPATLARSYRAERLLGGLVGLVALLVGAGAFVVGQGWLGSYRAGRSVVDPIAVHWLGARADWSRGVAIGVGVVLLVLGLVWFVRTLKVERRPDLVLDDVDDTALTITSGAVAAAVAADAEGIRGVNRAKVRPVGTPTRFGLRISLWLHDGTDLGAVYRELDDDVLDRARRSFGLDTLPAAVRLEIDTSTAGRVR